MWSRKKCRVVVIFIGIHKVSSIQISTYLLSLMVVALHSRMAVIECAKSREAQIFTADYSQKFIDETYDGYYEDKNTRIKVNMPIAVLFDFIRSEVIIRQKSSRKDLSSQPFTDSSHPLFCNRGKEKFSRWGNTYILKKYADAASAQNPGLIP